jgi:TolB protein
MSIMISKNLSIASVAVLLFLTAVQQRVPAVEAQSTLRGKIAFVSRRNGTLAIYTMKRDGSGTSRLLRKPKQAFYDMAFTPDSRKVAYAVPENAEQPWLPSFNIFVFDLKSGVKKRITNFHGPKALRALTPSFRPDGKQMAFTAMRKDKQSPSVYVVNVTSGRSRLLTATDDGGNPTYSKDGLWVSYTSGKGAASEIYIIKTDGTKKTRVTRNHFPDLSPSFHPNGKNIVFSSVRNGNYQICTIDLKSKREHQLTNSGQNRSASYSSDGRHIVFVSVRDGNEEIYTMKADGTNQKRLTNHPARDLNPIWLN